MHDLEPPPFHIVDFTYKWKNWLNRLYARVLPLTLTTGTGSPEGVVTGNIGDLYLNLSGGAATTLYVKTSSSGANTGWTAK